MVSCSGGPLPFAVGPLAGISKILRLKRTADNIGLANPRRIRFTQDNYRRTFGDGRSIIDLADALKAESANANTVPPIRVFERNGQVFSLDNRRLLTFKLANSPEIRVISATRAEVRRRRFSTRINGIGIEVRGVGGFRLNE